MWLTLTQLLSKVNFSSLYYSRLQSKVFNWQHNIGKLKLIRALLLALSSINSSKTIYMVIYEPCRADKLEASVWVLRHMLTRRRPRVARHQAWHRHRAAPPVWPLRECARRSGPAHRCGAASWPVPPPASSAAPQDGRQTKTYQQKHCNKGLYDQHLCLKIYWLRG